MERKKKMSAESARAFCVRMMSDEDFRAALGKVKSTAEIDKLVSADYNFTKPEFAKVIGEFVGHKLEEGELEKLICGFYEEQMEAGDTDVCKVVIEWLGTLN